MHAGNAIYSEPADLPRSVPLFPLSGALLLPQTQMPLNIFEPRYVAMIDAALQGDRLIGIIQPDHTVPGAEQAEVPPLMRVGCVGRIIAYQETGDGRYLVTLNGIARFTLVEELDSVTPFRIGVISAEDFADDFRAGFGEETVDREGLIKTLKDYLEANSLEADWDSIERASTEVLVNALAMMSPYGPAEKQALLEAPDLRTRADTLVALTEVELARQGGGDDGVTLQ
ncbi:MULTISPECIES: LON peptidase substrate-binding domain-containing protein [Stappia]|uniref:LON peptidase substrate-binding domain-containing protein n=1 Tax=Stappia taiwanensis TaxID=992267 RepID=A0A838XWM8_9HYPH|nr:MULTISPECIES: LON peptidase substrate-binding domain-containing protein [Stappia]MBA4612896.1 LON peptidase substrate-binding domain-containing protein [Stappia taiwanensis]MCA1299754.1 LON peptidase substrate-binding domain-containing protein [Stappia indica]GGF06974.1 ATP-dependent protease [Stappia taiwanensis]